jgi:capsular polysaccharide biosynthesis protein
MVNESAVRETLQPFGFKPYTLDEMEFEDQVRLFARAETVVAPHGAGLVNIMFGENLDVVELVNNHISDVYYMFAETLDHNYRYITCDIIDDDLYVDTDKLEIEVSQLIE